MPISPDVEMTVAGMILREPKNLGTALALGLSVPDFALPAPRAVFATAKNLWVDSKDVDLASVLAHTDALLADEIKALRRGAPYTQNFEPYAQAMLDGRHQVELEERLLEISRALTYRKPLEPLAPILERLAKLIAHCRGSERSVKATKIADAVAHSLREVEERLTTKQTLGVPTGIPVLDRVVYGFQKGSVYILGARTAVGKTTMAANMALSGATVGKKIAFVTVEMSAIDLANKLISRESRISSQAYHAGKLLDADFDNLHEASNRLSPLPITFVEVTKPTIDVLEFELLRLAQEGVDLVIIDYLQLFEMGDGRNRTPREEAKLVSTRIKTLARSLDIPILVLSQLNRQAPEYGEPDLVHIAESDQIARDADVVMFLYRSTEAGPYCLSVAKNRRGMRCVVALRAELEFSHFSQAPHER